MLDMKEGCGVEEVVSSWSPTCSLEEEYSRQEVLGAGRSAPAFTLVMVPAPAPAPARLPGLVRYTGW